MVAENARVHTGSLIVMTYQLTIENNSSPNPSGVEFVQLFLCCHDSLVVKPTARRRHIRRRLFNVAAQGLAIQPRKCRFEIFSLFNPPFFKRFLFFP